MVSIVTRHTLFDAKGCSVSDFTMQAKVVAGCLRFRFSQPSEPNCAVQPVFTEHMAPRREESSAL